MEIYTLCKIYFSLILISEIASDSKHVMDRLTYVEDRLDLESKVRRDDFSALFGKLENVEVMLQVALDKMFTVSDIPNKSPEYIAKVERLNLVLLRAFKEEKFLNERFRREIQENINDLNTHLEESKQANEDFPAILDNFAKGMSAMAEVVNSIKQDVTGKTQHLQDSQESSLNAIKHNGNITAAIMDKLNNLELSCAGDHSHVCECTGDSTSAKAKYTSCLDLYKNGFTLNGIYEIELLPTKKKMNVSCDMTTDGGGWTVFQRRQDGSVNFYRDWVDYKTGFGDLTGEFWLGNDYLHMLTNTVEPPALRVDLEDHEGNRAYAKYDRFTIGPESNDYTLKVGGYTGNAGDSLIPRHNGMKFTTRDKDNDVNTYSNCAKMHKGAWWFADCLDSNLNSLYDSLSCKQWTFTCVIWHSWKGWKYSLKFTEMKLR